MSEIEPVEGLRVERDGHVLTVTVDRPDRRNACTYDMWVGLRDVFRSVSTPDLRVVVLQGVPDAFCAGADLMAPFGDENTGGTFLGAMRVLGESVTAIHECPVPVVAKVDGVAVGAGFGLALAADLLYCSPQARFSAIFTNVGLSPDYGTSWLLTQRVGAHLAKQIALTAEMIDADRAVEYGLVNALVPEDELDAAVEEIVQKLAAGPPIALSLTKGLMNRAADSSLAQMLDAEALAQETNSKTEDLREAMRAFKEKRTPRFQGR